MRSSEASPQVDLPRRADGLRDDSRFVRLGARRGFHLLLVEETSDGFSPLLLG